MLKGALSPKLGLESKVKGQKCFFNEICSMKDFYSNTMTFNQLNIFIVQR